MDLTGITFSTDFHHAIKSSREEALRLGADHIDLDHLLLGILVNDVRGRRILYTLTSGADIHSELEQSIASGLPPQNMGNVPLTYNAERALKASVREAQGVESPEVDSAHLLLGFLSEREEPLPIFDRLNVTYEAVKNGMKEA